MKLEKYNRAAEAGDNESSGFVNYGAKKKVEGAYRTRRILMVGAYVLFALVYCIFFTTVVRMPMMIALLPVLIWIISYFTWCYVSVEYEYIIKNGNMKMMEVFGMRYYRTLWDVKVSSFHTLAEYKGGNRRADAAETKMYAVSTMSSPNIWCAVWKDADGKDVAAFFEAGEKTLKLMKYYNSALFEEAQH